MEPMPSSGDYERANATLKWELNDRDKAIERLREQLQERDALVLRLNDEAEKRDEELAKAFLVQKQLKWSIELYEREERTHSSRKLRSSGRSPADLNQGSHESPMHPSSVLRTPASERFDRRLLSPTPPSFSLIHPPSHSSLFHALIHDITPLYLTPLYRPEL